VTEVVYRLYETVDELTTVIENARSVPMSSSCMVPRDHLLDLLDDLRESLPDEVQQAGAIVEQRTEILQQAQAEAERLTGRTRSESDQVVATARRQREELIGTARRQRDEILTQAQAEADELLAEAEAEAEALVAEARQLRDQLIAEGRQQQAELVAAGEAEHERLLTETEVYRTAVDRADELGAQTARSTTTSTPGWPTSGTRCRTWCVRSRRPARTSVPPDRPASCVTLGRRPRRIG
jgi:cell division septum initiation protein DivIVA